MRFSLVLGAGGVVGMAYHAGALHALEQHAGLRPDDADLVVGTSAGSVIGSFLRSGWETSDLWQFALGTHPVLSDLPPAEGERRRQVAMVPGWQTPVELARRAIGSAWVLGRTVVRVPIPDLPAALRRTFPGGLFSMEDANDRFTELLPERWPERPLWLCAVDITSGRRVVLGRRGAPQVTLREAVMASCAIPGVYAPVRAGGRTLIDGGAHSTTNLDLVARRGAPLVVGVAPMAFETAVRPGPLAQLTRRRAAVSLSRELHRARKGGAEVLLVRPSADECDLHGVRLMNPESVEAVARAAYESTSRLVETTRFRRALVA